MTHVRIFEESCVRIGGPGVGVVVLMNFRVPRQKFELKPRRYNTYLLSGGRVQVCGYDLRNSTKTELYRLRSSLTEEHANLIFVRFNNSFQDMIPRVIENLRVVCELCATQHRMIGATDVIKTNLRGIQLKSGSTAGFPSSNMIAVFREHARAREERGGVRIDYKSGKSGRIWHPVRDGKTQGRDEMKPPGKM